jgi:hypothetical protein
MTATALGPSISVYAMRMYTERLQILISKEQRHRWEAEARRRDVSVARVVREAVDGQLGGIAREDRVAAVEWIAALKPLPHVPPEDLERAIADAYDAETRFPPEGAPR